MKNNLENIKIIILINNLIFILKNKMKISLINNKIYRIRIKNK